MNYGRADPEVSNSRLKVFGRDKPEYALPRAGYTRDGYQRASALERSQERTFSVEPQKRAIRFPFDEDGSFEKPVCCLLAMGGAGNIVVNRGVRGREPSTKILS